MIRKRLALLMVGVICAAVSFSAIAAPPTFSVAFLPTTVAPSTRSTMTYTIDNSAESTGVSGLTFSNTLPTGMTIASPNRATTTNSCFNGNYNATPGSNSVTFDSYRLAAGSSCTFSMDVLSSTVGSSVNTTSALSSSAGSAGAATANLTVDATRPGFNMAFSPASIVPGAVSRLTYTIDNTLNGSDVSFYGFFNTLPAGLVVSQAVNSSTTCAGTMTASAGGTTVQFGSLSLSAGAACTVSLDVTAATAALYTNVSGTLNRFGSNSSGIAAAELSVANAYLSAVFPNQVVPGQSVNLSFTINNLDRGNSATDITFSNDLNATLSGLVATVLPSNDFCGSGSTLTGTSTITVTGANLAAEASCSFDVTVLIPTNAAAGSYTNTTSTVNLTLGSATTKPAASSTLQVKTAPTLTALFIDDPVSAGQNVTVRYVLTNTDAAKGAFAISFEQRIDESLSGVIVDNLPSANSCGAGSTFAEKLDSSGRYNQVEVADASLTAGSSCTFDVILSVPAGATPNAYAFTTSLVTATVNGEQLFGLPATDNLIVVAAPALSLAIVEDFVVPGGTVDAQFTLNYSLNATANAAAVGFTVDLDAALTGMVASGVQTDVCGAGSTFDGTSTLTLSGASLIPGGSCTFSTTLQIPAMAIPRTITPTSSTISATTAGQSVSSAAASDSLVVTGLTLAKTFVNNPVLAGSSTAIRYTISNAATALAATNINFTDNLNNALSLLSATSWPATPCFGGSQISGVFSLSFDNGELQPGESCVFDVPVLIPAGAAVGTYNSATSKFTADVNAVNTENPAASTSVTVEELTVQLSSTASNPTSVSPIPVSINFSRPVINFDSAVDLVIANGTAGVLSGSGSDYTVAITPSADGAVTIDLPAGGVDDAVVSIQNPAATQLSLNYAATPPTSTPSAVISAPNTSLVTAGPVTYTVTYTDAATVNLTTAGISLDKTGASSATVSVTDGDTATPTVTLSNISGDGTLGISISANSARNGVNVAPAAGPSTTFTVDNTQPTLVITDTVTNSFNAAFTATLTFSEDVFNFVSSDITPGNATLSNFTAQSATVYTVIVTPVSQGLVTLDVAANSAIDPAGNGNVAAGQYSLTFDSIAPSVVITSPSLPANNPYIAPFIATFTFSEDVTGFDVADIAVTNAGLSNFAFTSAREYTALVTPTADGLVTLNIAGSRAIDLAANDNSAAMQLSVNYDATLPSVSITGGPNLVNGTITATFTFSEAVTGFAEGDIAVANANLSSFTTSSPTTYTVVMTPIAEGTFTLDLAADSAVDIGGNGNSIAAQLSRVVNPVVTLSASINSVVETGGTTIITATTNIPPTTAIVVNLAYTGTSTNGTDYATGASSISILAGQTSASTTLTVTADSIPEAAETLIVDIDSVTGGATNSATESGTQQQTVTITDDDVATVTLSASTNSIAEAAGVSTITATLSNVSFEVVTVNLGYTGSAGNTDYMASAKSITIAAGQTTGSETLTATVDTTIEAVESIVVDITGVSGGSASENGTQQQTVTITDDDVATVSLSASTNNIAEAAGVSTITATLSNVSFEAVTVSLGYSGSAGNADYMASANSITIAAGQTSGTVTLTATVDAILEAAEGIIVDITGVSSGSASENGTQQQTVNITDDDVATVSLSASTNNIAEAVGVSTITATLNKVSFEAVIVTLGYSGTVANTDYMSSANSITIAAGQTTAIATLTATQDTAIEAAETIVIDITAVSGGSASENGTQQQTVTIIDDDVATVTLSASINNIAETAGVSVITATLNKVSFEAVIVNLGYTGTAGNTDYTASANSITIAAGQATGTATLTATADTMIEAVETITVDITGVSGGSASENGTQQQSVSITDDDVATVSLSASINSIAEAGGVSTMTATLSNVSFEAVTVSLGYSGTAVVNVDFAASANSITIAAGQTTGTATLTATADRIIEAAEIITVDITAVSGGSASENGTQQQTVTITDDDVATVTLSTISNNITEAEGSSSSSTITATLDNVSFEAVIVSLGYSGTAAVNADYTASANSITIAAGQTTGTATLIAIQDTVSEAAETIVIDITGVSGGSASENGAQQQTVTINDDDVVTVTLSTSTNIIGEAMGVSTVTATLNRVAFEAVNVSLGYTGSAGNTDYTASANNIIIAAGEVTGTATLTAIQDTAIEAAEIITVDITAVSGGSGVENSTQQQNITITDDDVAAVVLSTSTNNIAEAAGISTITATLDKASFEAITVSLVYNGTATSGIDFVLPASSIMIPAGETIGTTLLTAIDDAIVEQSETVIVDIASLSGSSAIESNTQQQTVTINDDETSSVSVSISQAAIAEAAGTSILTVMMAKTTFEDVVVGLAYGGIATGGNDYAAVPVSVTIPKDQSTATVTFTAIQDVNAEGNETIVIEIASVTGGSAIESGVQQQTLTITDDDTVAASLIASTTNILEASGSTTLTATLDKTSFEAVTVTLGYAGTATSGTDYESPAVEIVIPAGQTNGTTVLTATNDAITEANETIIVNVTAVSGGSASENGTQQQTITITDDDVATVTLSASISNIAEAVGISTITATLSKQSSAVVTVSLGYTGSAGGTDYKASANSITIAAGETIGTATLTSTQDMTVEADETIIVDITGVSGGSASESVTQQQTVVIVDDDLATVVLSTSIDNIAEAAGVSTMTATLNNASFEAVVVSLGFTGSAVNTDYTASANSITIAAGQTTGTAILTATEDEIIEAAETITVDITGVSGGSASESGTQQQTVTITDDDVATVTLSVSTNDIAELAGISTITATLDKMSIEAVTVSLGYTGSAANTDYAASANSITIAAGETKGTATLTAIEDTIIEATKMIVVDITGVSGGSASENGTQQQTVTIADDDVASVTLSASINDIAEASGVSSITATLDKVSFEAVTVSLAYTGTVVSTDYTASASSIIIAAGETTGSATLTATQDNTIEAAETIIVDITGVSGGSASESGTQQQTVTITDDDVATVTLSTSINNIVEAAGTSTVTATLDNASFEAVTVNLTYSGTATSGADYVLPASTITIAAGETMGTTVLTAIDDAVVEQGETIIVDIASVSGGSATESTTQQQTVTINDDETSSVSLNVSQAAMAEAADTSVLTVTMAKSTFDDVVVGVTYSGTATSDVDYGAVPISVTIPTGQSTASITITATQDGDIEGDETIVIDIASVTGGSAVESGVQQQTLTITDDDSVTVSLSASTTDIQEAAGNTTLTATLDQVSYEDVTIALAYTGTATSGTDYVSPAVEIVIPAGQTTGTTELAAINDATAEASETIIVEIAAVSGGAASESGVQQQTLTIIDDDAVAVTLSASNASILEAAGSSTLTVTLDKSTYEAVIVSLAYSGIATSGTDYLTPLERVTVAAGETTASVTLTAIQDLNEEADEAIVIDISGVSGGGAIEDGAQQQAVTITNDDNETGSDSVTVDEDSMVQIDVLANDIGAGARLNPASVAIKIATTKGTASINTANGVITYTPQLNVSGNDKFTYTVIDLLGVLSAPTTVSITINSVNDAPVAANDASSVEEDSSVVVDVLANDSDVDSAGDIDTASLSVTVPALHGTAAVIAGKVTYTPRADYSGSDMFSYTLRDNAGALSNVATVSVNVGSINDAPRTVVDTGSTNEDTELTLAVLDNDVEVDGSIDKATLAIVLQPVHGAVLVQADGTLLYTPAANYFGSDTLSYSVKDDLNAVSIATLVTVNVIAVNDAPVASDDMAILLEDNSFDINVAGNDSDVDNPLDTGSLTTVIPPANGSVSLNNGMLRYTPNANFGGSDSFAYTINDNAGAVSNAATVTITVQAVNDLPIANDDSVVTIEDVAVTIDLLANDQDVDGTLDPASVILGEPSQGTLLLDLSTGIASYTPAVNTNGDDSFTYTVSDNEAGLSNTATVVVRVSSVNDAPATTIDSASTDEDTAVVIAVLDNDIEVDGQINPASLVITLGANQGDVVVQSDGQILYTPFANVFGTDTFLYTVKDDVDAVSPETLVTIIVNPVNDAPIVSGTPQATVLEGAAYSFTPLITDADGDSLTVTMTNFPTWLSVDAAGVLTGMPVVGDSGFYTDIVMSVDDGQTNTVLPTFTIEVIGDNDLDGISDSDDLDDDNDGMNDLFEIANNFNPVDSSDAGGDADNDGVSNLDELLQGSNPRLDDQGPVISQPVPITINASSLLTKVSGLIAPLAVDGIDGEVPAELIGAASLVLAPGRHTVIWFALDAAGNRSEVIQQIDINPLISINSAQVLGEGSAGDVRVLLNGLAPEYPFSVSFEVGGTSDSLDHDLVSGNLLFLQGELESRISFNIALDDVSEGAETLEISLVGDGNIGSQNKHTATIVEDNVAPETVLTVIQNTANVLIIEQVSGLVDFTAVVTDANPADQHTAEWRFPQGIVPTTVNELQRQLDPADLSPGTYNLTVIVTDSGVPALSDQTNLTFQVVAAHAVLTDQDSDGDGISDVLEGWADDDQDGQPNYLDTVSLPNVINAAASDGMSYLVESDPGLKMVLGERALASGAGGAELDMAQIPADLTLPSDNVVAVSGYFDFVVDDLGETGDSVNIVLPQRQMIPSGAIYRKYSDVWFTFVEDAKNNVKSAVGEPGNCPPPESESYRNGLNVGDWCVQLTIEDGGPNDADGIANGSVNDPGGVARLEVVTVQSNRSGGGGSLGWGLMVLLVLLGLRYFRHIGLHRVAPAAALLLVPVLLALPSQSKAMDWATLQQNLHDKSYVELGVSRRLSPNSSTGFVEALAADGIVVDLQEYDVDRWIPQFSLGYRYVDWSAVEIGYMDLGDANIAFSATLPNRALLGESINSNYPVAGKGWTVGNRFEYSRERINLTGEVGLLFWGSDIDIGGTLVENDQNSERDAYLGLGIGYQLSERWDVSLNWRRVFFPQQVKDLAGLGLGFRF